MDYPLCIVEWVDIAGTSSYWQGDETARFISVVSIGWVTEDTKEKLTIVQSLTDEEDHGGVLTMPKEVVRSVKKIKGSRR